MRRFKFTLEQVLRLKAAQKRQVSSELSQLEAAYAVIESKIHRLSEQWQQETEALRQVERNLVAAEYALRVNYLDYLDHKMNEEKQRLLHQSHLISETRQKLSRLAREEKTLQRLRMRQQVRHEKEQARLEQAEIDDIAAQRRVYTERHIREPQSGTAPFE